MKALSLLQPWATLIMLGYKEFETRSWGTTHRGPLAIAASAGKQGREACAPGTDLAVLLANHNLTFDDLPRGAILGVCQVDSMHKMDETWDLVLGEVELACGDYTNGRVAWALSDVKAFITPVPCKGKLSLWEVPAEVRAQFKYAPVPSKEALAAALHARYGGPLVELDAIRDIMPLEHGELHFQATRNARTDWYAVTLNPAGQFDATSIIELPF
jgi:hypothetical protein